MGVIPNGEYPRPLSTREREWIDWVLPAARKGYGEFRARLTHLVVVGEGRRGKGEFVLGKEGGTPDFSNPLPPVFAYGMIETDSGGISITVRDMADDQVSVEIVSQRSDVIPERYAEHRRWTYSTWNPGEACPQCQMECREIPMRGDRNDLPQYTLAVCPADRRLWVHDASSLVNRLIPVTNFYNELMLHKGIRDPGVALDSKNLFKNLRGYSDGDLRMAFRSYNQLKTKVPGEDFPPMEGAKEKISLKKILHLFKKT